MVLVIILSSVNESDVKGFPTVSNPNTISNGNGSPIVIYRDSYSPTSMVHIVINAPDFNSNSYAIDTIGDDPENKLVVSTRGSSIPYRLVETGTDTGVFTGYVTLSGATSTCSPICGPMDGYLAASGDDAITVSFTYTRDRTITSTMESQGKINQQTIPEFGSLACLVITTSIFIVVIYSRKLETK